MSSVEYRALVQSVNELKTDLMNFAPSPTVPYSNADLLKCQAFVVFSHAEMQVYWQTVATRILTEAERRWKNDATVDRVLGAVVAFRRPDNVSVPNDPSKSHNGGKLEWIVEESVKSQKKVIDNNNGIKRSNIAALFLPIGVLIGDLVEPLLIQLDQTGRRRGDIVHKSSKISLRTIRDPFADEMNDIDELVKEIGLFDTKLESLGLLS